MRKRQYLNKLLFIQNLTHQSQNLHNQNANLNRAGHIAEFFGEFQILRIVDRTVD